VYALKYMTEKVVENSNRKLKYLTNFGIVIKSLLEEHWKDESAYGEIFFVLHLLNQ